MNIIPVTLNINNYHKIKDNNVAKYNNKSLVSFKSNPDSVRLLIKPADFFVNIKGYGSNINWACQIKKLTDDATKLIRKGKDSDEILPYIAHNMKRANSFDLHLRQHTGRIRTYRARYGIVGEWGEVRTIYTSKNKYSSYKKRLDEKIKKPLNNPYPDADFMTKLSKGLVYGENCITHGECKSINIALDKVSEIHKNLQEKYISKPENVTIDKLKDINSDVAEIRWIIAHSTPWERGSDSIGNSYIRALYKAMGIQTSPLKKGVSLDLEAYCTELPEYKKNFASYFEKAPEIMD